MKLSKRVINTEYFFVQAIFWMGFCTIVAFAAVYMQDRGYSNTELGVVLCLGNIFGLILSPVLASLVDKYAKVDNLHTYWVMLALQSVLFVLLLFITGKSLAVSAIYVLLLTCNACAGPMVTQLSFELEGLGHHVNFGIARSGGSLACAIFAPTMGTIISRFGCRIVAVIGLIIMAVEAAILAVVTLQICRAGLFGGGASTGRSAESKSLGGFIAGNKRFFIFVLGLAVLYIPHSALTNFMVNVVNNVGGDTVTLGRINGYTAFMELPTMLLADRLMRKWKLSSLMRFAVITFTVKALAIALATSVPLLFVAMATQTISYAVLTPVIVRYVERVISPADEAKGQSLAYTSLTLGSIFSSIIVGPLFDSLGTTPTMFISVGISLVGTLICLFSIQKTPDPKALGTV